MAVSLAALPTGDVTLVFTDLERSSELTERFGKPFEAVRDVHFRLLREALRDTGGFEVETAGDALLAAFHQAAAAVRFAVEAQQKIKSFHWPSLITGLPPLKVRIGMHTGEPHIGRDEASGRPVYRGAVTNRAARVQGAAHGGQILLSGATQSLASTALPPEVTLRPCGTHRLKGVGEMTLWQVLHSELPSEFPPLTTLDPQRHNLPVPLMPLVGREADIAEWHALLRRSTTRVLTLWAFGGMGKTRSALQLAETCAAEDTTDITGEAAPFKDGVWWVWLETATSADEMLSAIAASLSLESQPGSSLKEQLWNFLKERHLLLVLDNTEQIVDAGAVIGELLGRAPGVKCLVTSRHALELVAEERREVPPLPMEDAARLFVEIVAKTGNTLDSANHDVREVCRRLECVPLALELAASRVGLLTPAEIVEHLDDQLRFLKLKNAKDLPPRQRALRAAIDWSYAMLAEDNQELFAELAVFVGGFTLVDANAVSESDDVFDGIAELHRCSMLRAVTDAQTQRTRYFMLDSLRAYAAEKLEQKPDGGRAAYERHARHFAALMDKFAGQLRTSTENEALTLSAPHLDNARAACDFAMNNGKVEIAARLALSLGRLHQRAGAFREASQRLQAGYELAQRTAHLDGRLCAHLVLAWANAYYDAFNWTAAQQLGEKALAAFEELDDAMGQADVYNLLGLIARRGHKDFEATRRHFSKASTLFNEAGFAIGVALTRNNQGVCEQSAGDSKTARPHYEAALEIYREEGYERGVAEVLTNLGVLTQEDGNLDEAWHYYQSAFEIELRWRHQFGVARGLYNLGEIAATRGQANFAGHLFAAAKNLFDRVGSPFQKDAALGLEGIVASNKDLPATHWATIHSRLKGLPLEQVAQWALAAGA